MAETADFGYPAAQAKEGWDMGRNGRRLIEDYLPIEDVSKEASREKSVRKGHISTLHLWWGAAPWSPAAPRFTARSFRPTPSRAR